jgi:hypothetical protein
VAIKTVIDVTDENLRSFREEILLTASLKHPNIVNFVVKARVKREIAFSIYTF